ncbi:hypothetical protein ZC03_055 [Pseudomonas phage ZC03]|uniref:Uncharacterized protein n=1 Tax=Pseudomonas phage ZC03 TaxID=1622115 RepID=A0A1L2C953_9CAUD|nr:hypothetical protein HWA93_gp74 [Pseudomonas phage ZC03]AMD43432.1 hypothetical protein ZC03_055 [Pseudomonas phage ZC03]
MNYRKHSDSLKMVALVAYEFGVKGLLYDRVIYINYID